MILGGFKRKNIERKIDKYLQKSSDLKAAKGIKIKSILLLVEESTDKKMLQVISKKLNVSNSKVSIILFEKKNKKELNSGNSITQNDFSLFGKFKNEEVKKILNSNIDLLINYVGNNQYLNCLAVQSNALFKVGFLDKNKFIYDLMIDVAENDFKMFNSELKKYLKILNKI